MLNLGYQIRGRTVLFVFPEDGGWAVAHLDSPDTLERRSAEPFRTRVEAVEWAVWWARGFERDTGGRVLILENDPQQSPPEAVTEIDHEGRKPDDVG